MLAQADFTTVVEFGRVSVLANYLLGTLDAIDADYIDEDHSISVEAFDKAESA